MTKNEAHSSLIGVIEPFYKECFDNWSDLANPVSSGAKFESKVFDSEAACNAWVRANGGAEPIQEFDANGYIDIVVNVKGIPSADLVDPSTQYMRAIKKEIIDTYFPRKSTSDVKLLQAAKFETISVDSISGSVKFSTSFPSGGGSGRRLLFDVVHPKSEAEHEIRSAYLHRHPHARRLLEAQPEGDANLAVDNCNANGVDDCNANGVDVKCGINRMATASGCNVKVNEQVSSSGDDGDGDDCFAIDSLITLQYGQAPQKIQDVKHGDIIMTHSPSDLSTFEYKAVHTITHHDVGAVSTGVKIRTASKHVLKITQRHMIPVCSPSIAEEGGVLNQISKCPLKLGKHVIVGDMLVIVSSSAKGHRVLVLSAVQEVQNEVLHGLFNLHAGSSGEQLIVVNDILVSTKVAMQVFGSAELSDDEKNGLLTLSRGASRVMPHFLKSLFDKKYARYQYFSTLSDKKKAILKDVGRAVSKATQAGSREVTFSELVLNGFKLRLVGFDIF